MDEQDDFLPNSADLAEALRRYVDSDSCDCTIYEDRLQMCRYCQGLYALGETPDPDEQPDEVREWLAADPAATP